MKVRKQSIEELNKWYEEGCNNTPPEYHIQRNLSEEKIQMWHASTNIGKILPPPDKDCLLSKMPLVYRDGGFSDGSNDYSSFIGAYNEEEEREIAENILDWWNSKLPYNEWYAKKFSPRLFDDNELEI